MSARVHPMKTPALSVPESVLKTAKHLVRDGKPQTVTAAAAQATFAEVLDSAVNNPVTVTRDGKPAAIVLSARHYREWLRVLAAVMEEMEDREWAQKAREAEAEGFATPEESEALMRDLREKYGD